MSTLALNPARSFGPRHRWRVLAIGAAANACLAAILAGIPTTAVFMRTDYHLSTEEIGFALGLLGLGIALSELPWGLLTDRLGDRRVLLAGLGVTALALAFLAAFVSPVGNSVPSLSLLSAGLCAAGLCIGSVNGSSGRAVMAWFTDGERGFAMSIRQTAVPLGGAIGALVLPPIAASFGFMPVYGVLALACVVNGAFVWAWLHEPPVVTSAQPGVQAPAASMKQFSIWRIALAIGLFCCPQVAVLTFSAIFLHDFGGASIATISATIFFVQIGAAVMRVWSGRWTDRRRNRRPFLRGCAWLSAAIFTVLAALVALQGSIGASQPLFAAIIAVLVLGGICASAWHGVAFTELATLAGASRVGTALALGNTCAFAAFFLTPIIVSQLLPFGAWPAAWFAMAICSLFAIPVFPPKAA